MGNVLFVVGIWLLFWLMEKYNIVGITVVTIFIIAVYVIIGLLAYSVFEYTFSTGDLAILLFFVVFFMSLKYN